MGKLLHEKWLWVVLAIILAAFSFGVYSRIRNNKSTPSHEENASLVNTNLCNNDSIGEKLKTDFPYFEQKDVDGMATLVEDIKKLPDYTKGINCTYVLGKYSALTGLDTVAAEYYLEAVRLYESSGNWVDESIGHDSPEEVKDMAEFLGRPIDESSSIDMQLQKLRAEADGQ